MSNELMSVENMPEFGELEPLGQYILVQYVDKKEDLLTKSGIIIPVTTEMVQEARRPYLVVCKISPEITNPKVKIGDAIEVHLESHLRYCFGKDGTKKGLVEYKYVSGVYHRKEFGILNNHAVQ